MMREQTHTPMQPICSTNITTLNYWTSSINSILEKDRTKSEVYWTDEQVDNQ
jgi:hypothetical protein